MKKVLITGPLGQDGIILTKLLQNDFELFGVCRMLTKIDRFNEHKKKYNINLLLSELGDINYVDHLIKNIRPDIIVNFAGETDVINPYKDTNITYEQNFEFLSFGRKPGPRITAS
jgi:GDP-D-mannose dehydratase